MRLNSHVANGLIGWGTNHSSIDDLSLNPVRGMRQRHIYQLLNMQQETRLSGRLFLPFYRLALFFPPKQI